MSDDPFGVLGLGRDATVEQARQARRRLASLYHPDHGGDPIRMGQINVAFDAVIHLLTQPPPPAPRVVEEAPVVVAATREPRPRYPGVQHDAPSFTIDSLPVDAFEALLVVTSWMGEVLVDDPPYVLEVHLTEPAPCWCRLDLVPDAGSSTVSLTVASVDGTPAPDVELVRDLWVANLNRL
ncbi:MAG: J domain-containing protein [Ilumatobacteraceae bacterium]